MNFRLPIGITNSYKGFADGVENFVSRHLGNKIAVHLYLAGRLKG